MGLHVVYVIRKIAENVCLSEVERLIFGNLRTSTEPVPSGVEVLSLMQIASLYLCLRSM